MGGMRERDSEVTPFMAMSHDTIYGHTRTAKARRKVALSQTGGTRQGVLASTLCMDGKRFQLPCPTQKYTIGHMTMGSWSYYYNMRTETAQAGPAHVNSPHCRIPFTSGGIFLIKRSNSISWQCQCEFWRCS